MDYKAFKIRDILDDRGSRAEGFVLLNPCLNQMVNVGGDTLLVLNEAKKSQKNLTFSWGTTVEVCKNCKLMILYKGDNLQFR